MVTKKDVNEQLACCFTPAGCRKWWDRLAWQLGQTPWEAWSEGRKQEVYDLAESYRDMVAT